MSQNQIFSVNVSVTQSERWREWTHHRSKVVLQDFSVRLRLTASTVLSLWADLSTEEEINADIASMIWIHSRMSCFYLLVCFSVFNLNFNLPWASLANDWRRFTTLQVKAPQLFFPAGFMQQICVLHHTALCGGNTLLLHKLSSHVATPKTLTFKLYSTFSSCLNR